MTPAQIKHYGARFNCVLQSAMSAACRISDYEGEDNVPAPLQSPLTKAELEPFLDQDRLITFTVRVPLDILVAGGDALYSDIVSTAFEAPVTLSHFEFRAVGASFGAFDEQFSGDVHLQVTGDISTLRK